MTLSEIVDEAWEQAQKRLCNKKADGTPELRGMRSIFKEELLKLLWQPVIRDNNAAKFSVDEAIKNLKW